MESRILTTVLGLLVLAGMTPLRVPPAFAHCDGLDGPVVKAAQRALEGGDVKLVLIWVQANDEPEIRQAFEQAMAVRKVGPQARDLADRYFFETLVRIHRAGEGAPYTGLKPEGRDVGPAIPAADKALEEGKLEPLFKLLTHAIHEGLHRQFDQAMAKRNFGKADVEAGREYIEAYVRFIHYVEGLYEAAADGSHGHHPEAAGGEGHKH